MRYQFATMIFLSFLLACGNKDNEGRVEYIEKIIEVPNEVSQGASSNSKYEPCTTTLKSECLEIENKVASVEKELDAAIQAGDLHAVKKARITLNELSEILKSYRLGEADVSEIHSRYDALRKILDAVNPGDQLPPNISYLPSELQAVQKVFADFGELYIEATPVDENGKALTIAALSVQQDDHPWTGYWYPKNRADMFDGPNSPLAKFDRFLRNRGIESAIVDWERERWRPGLYASWEGLSDALTIASVLTKEPKGTIALDGVNFSAADQKALAVKYYEGYEPVIYGMRYEGASNTDGEMQDIRPEAFHRIMEVMLGERKQAVIVDIQPGPEVWVKPIHRISWSISKDPEYENAFLVKAFPTVTHQRNNVPMSDLESLTDYFKDTSTMRYEYRLFVNPDDRRGQKVRVIAGEWLHSSKDQHPDFIVLPMSDVNSKTLNAELAKHKDELRNLLSRFGMLKAD